MGIVERQNKTTKTFIKKFIEKDCAKCDTLLPVAICSHNFHVNEGTNYSPYFLFHGREPLTRLDLVTPVLVSDVNQSPEENAEAVSKAKEEAVKITTQAQEKRDNLFNAKKKNAKSIERNCQVRNASSVISHHQRIRKGEESLIQLDRAIKCWQAYRQYFFPKTSNQEIEVKTIAKTESGDVSDKEIEVPTGMVLSIHTSSEQLSRGSIKDFIQGDCFSFDIDLWQVDRRERLIHLQGTPRQLYEAQTRNWITMFEDKAWNHTETYLPEMKPTPYPVDYPRILQMNPAEVTIIARLCSHCRKTGHIMFHCMNFGDLCKACLMPGHIYMKCPIREMFKHY
ncbi:unnamed protein product [Allacma fusca]|uniref:Uncharacterized protein n=1 Tax=Allacma fusca TaxID=39272 RepID=A0A8J2P0D8_9HEXA|nr:unnamed protein product [Allacma fusca]